MIVMGITGPIAAGKSTVARALEGFGAALFDADAEVWAYYQGEGLEAVGALFPEARVAGRIDRARLSALALADPQALRRLEELVHPVVAARRRTFLSEARARGARMAAMEIPLLVETGGERFVDVVALVDAAEAIRRERALARPGMNAQKLAAIVARQADDAQRRRRAHFVIDAGGAMESTRAQARDLFRALAGSEKEKPGDA